MFLECRHAGAHENEDDNKEIAFLPVVNVYEIFLLCSDPQQICCIFLLFPEKVVCQQRPISRPLYGLSLDGQRDNRVYNTTYNHHRFGMENRADYFFNIR